MAKVIRHIDGNPLNNEPSNLEIVEGKADWQLDVEPSEQDGYGNETQQTPDPYGWPDEPDPND